MSKSIVASRGSARCSFVVLIALAACGGGSPGPVPGSVTGTIHGGVYSIGDAISAPVTFIGSTQRGAAILLSSSTNACNDATSPPIYPSEKRILIELFDAAGVTYTTPTTPGTYTIYPGTGMPPERTAALDASVFDTTCQVIAASAAKRRPAQSRSAVSLAMFSPAASTSCSIVATTSPGTSIPRTAWHSRPRSPAPRLRPAFERVATAPIGRRP